MRIKTLLSVVGICIFSYTMAQDGSNIKYYDADKLDDSFIGKLCHIDFGKVSFRGLNIDTLEIDVIGKRMTFYENRKDDGFNNLFSEQYLLVFPNKKTSTTRLQDSRIDSLTTEKIYVTSVLSYYHNESSLDTITVFQHCYDKKNIAKVLIKQ